MKRVLITGKNSYVGTNVERCLMREPDKYYVETISLRDPSWKEFDFSRFDVVFHVAGIVHKKEKKVYKESYDNINTFLTYKIAKIARKSGVSHFIFMSSISVYGEEGEISSVKVLDESTKTNPKSFYGASKLNAEKLVNKLQNEHFNVLSVRAPMIYGENSPGNSKKIRKLIQYINVMPQIDNKRSMIHIDKLSEDILECINTNRKGYIVPQDKEYRSTKYLINYYAKKQNKKIIFSRFLGTVMKLLFGRMKIIKKIYGSLIFRTIEIKGKINE